MSSKPKKLKSLLDLESCDCRWPIGDPRQSGFHFCGAQAALGRPYCIEHWQLSFVTRTQGGQSQGQQSNAGAGSMRALPVRRAA